MADNWLQRTELMLGSDAIDKLKHAHVALFGVGGVGGYCAEALIRAGIGKITIVDNDDVDVTNINRQIIALHSTVGRPKTEVMAERLHDISPDAEVIEKRLFFLLETAGEFDFDDYDYVIDAIDTVKAKLDLISRCISCGTPIISAMGAGNKTDPSMFRIADISKTEMDPLAKVMRRELRARGISHLKVVYSPEKPHNTVIQGEGAQASRHAPGSISFVPPAAGLLLASEVVHDLINK
ncbi:MAG: tRNA threonylcarbamoyladenosine dehydratase [Eubacterium sp.]|nr:tRNA threonylcarbamoyladenosine dehydratase [Eubacterium sp.]